MGTSTDQPVTWIACAHPTEGMRLQQAGLPVHVLGVGKIASTLSLTRLFASGTPRRLVVVGVAGAYPARHVQEPLPEFGIGSLVVARESVLADEGVETEDGFEAFSRFGLDDSTGVSADPEMTRAVAERLGIPSVRCATVSTCSGSESLSRGRATRTGAAIETMESAAIGQVCRAFSVSFVELRSISNWTGDRTRGDFRLELAADVAQDAVLTLWNEGLLTDPR